MAAFHISCFFLSNPSSGITSNHQFFNQYFGIHVVRDMKMPACYFIKTSHRGGVNTRIRGFV